MEAETAGRVNECNPLPAKVPLDLVWGGTRVGFAAQESDDFIYAGYYDSDRWLAVSRISKCTGKVEKQRLSSRFLGWDAHNKIVLTLDGAGRLHLAGNMHVTPLVYARLDKPDDFAALASTRPMTRMDEDRVTYPNFFRFSDGALGFSYRSGRSGDGNELVNRFDGERWHRWTDEPVFSPTAGQASVNAYHTGFALGPDGFFHVAWVWRKDHWVETNFHVSYAKSKDLKSWQDSTGRPVNLPLTPANAEVVDPVPPESGLFNNIKLGFDAKGQPVISYLKFDSRGNSQLFHARVEKGSWHTVQSTDWSHRWDPRGGGTIPSEISFSGVSVRDGRLIEHVRHPKIGTATLNYEHDSLRAVAVLKSHEWSSEPKIDRQTVPGAVLNVLPLRLPDGRQSKNQALSWLSHPADNRDKPRDCSVPGLSCNFVSELLLHTNPARSVPDAKNSALP